MDQFTRKNFLKLMPFAVFVGGAAVMIVELIGSRIMAPYAGTSLIVWTTLIGIILAALSFGYWVGGRLADRFPYSANLGWIFICSAISIAVILWLSTLLPNTASQLITSTGLVFGSLVIATALFALPSILLGMVTPFALRLSFNDKNNSGAVAGTLYAASTIGSIAGTFACGFYFVPVFGSFKTLAVLAIILALLGLIFVRSRRAGIAVFLIAIATAGMSLNAQAFSPSNAVMADRESAYNRLFVVKSIDTKSSRPLISIMSGPHLSQSAQFIDQDNDLVFDYTKFFRSIDYFHPNSERVLMIGGGAYSVPRDFLKRHSSASIDVVEIDPLYTELAREYFNLTDNKRLRIYHEDARLFVRESKQNYDAIFVDAFNNAGSVPFHLTTREAIQDMHSRLLNGGVVIVNMIGSFNGLGSNFIASEYETYKEVFGKARLFALGKGDEVQNIMLVAVKEGNWPPKASPEQEINSFIEQEYKEIPSGRVLTDDWAPVDYFLSGIL